MIRAEEASHSATSIRSAADLIVAIDVGSARVACAIAELGHERPVIIAAEAVNSYGIRSGEIVDMKRASEAIRIAIQAAAERADAEVRTVVVGLSGDARLSSAKAALQVDRERRTVTVSDVLKLKNSVAPELPAGRRVIHRFDGPYAVGDLQGIEHPEGLAGERLEMQAAFLSASGDRLDNVLRAVRNAGVEIETVALEPMSSSIGVLSPDERALGAAVLDFGAGAFRGALWEGGRLRQIHLAGADPVQTCSGRVLGPASVTGMDGLVLALARRFRIAPATADRLLRTHATLDEDELATLPLEIEVAAVDGLGSVRIETRELSRTVEELLIPVARSLREGLSGFSPGHSVGVVLTGGGAQLRGITPWVAKRFGGAPVRVGVPRWRVAEAVQLPAELKSSGACGLAGLVLLGAEQRVQFRVKRGPAFFRLFVDGLRRFAASL